MGERTLHRLLLLLLVAYWGLGTTYALVMPCFESPDEWSHLSLVRYWSKHKRLPPRVISPRDQRDTATETWYFGYHDPPLYYAPPLYHSLAALLTFWTDMDDLPDLLVPSPSWEKGWVPVSNSDPANKNIFAHRAEETWQQSGTVRAAWGLRLFSLALGSIVVVSAYRMARFLWPERAWLPLAAAAFVAFNPQFLALSIGVTNDNLLNALFGLGLAWALILMRDDGPWYKWAALGGIGGLALLTKQNGLLLLPIGLLAVAGQPGGGRSDWRKMLLDGTAFVGAALAVGGWWYVRNAALYADPLGLEPHFASQWPLSQFGRDEVGQILRSSWAAFGWAPLLVDPLAYRLAGTVLLLALIGLGFAVQPGSPLWRAPRTTRRGLALLTLALGLNLVSFARWAVATGVLSGRLLFASLPAASVLAVWGLSQWGRWRAGRWGLGLVAGLAFLFAAAVPWLYLRPAYGSPRLAGPMPDSAHPVDLAFEDGIELAGYEPLHGDLHPGETKDLTVYWSAATAPAGRYRVWVQLGPQDAAQKVISHDTWLGGTLYPSDLWRAGDVVRQGYRLDVPDWAPAPALYWIRIGLVDAETGDRARLASGGSDMVVLGPWRMRGEAPTVSPTSYATHIRLGSAICLTGYDLRPPLDDEKALRLTFYWEAVETPDADYTVFVHVLDGTGALLGQHDAPPREGGYPTSWWLPGEVIADAHTVQLEGSGAEGRSILVGMYDPATMVRLPAYDTAGRRLPDDVIRLDGEG